jgi:hypothetical protein
VNARPKGHDRAPQLTRDELLELFSLIQDVDSVELKLTVPDDERQLAIEVLGVDPLDVQIRQVYFFDTPDLTLNKIGLVPRARRIQRGGADSVVKLRPVVPNELPAKLRASPDFRVEVDAMPGGYVCSGALKAKSAHDRVREVVAGRRPLRALFTKQQRALFAEHAPDGITFEDLSVLGPVNVMKLKFTPEGASRKLALELWTYPGDLRLLEISTRIVPKEIWDAAGETSAFLRSKGLSLAGAQETKTQAALTIFSGRLKKAAATAG